MQVQEQPTAIDPTLVKDMVSNAHGDLARVRELLAQTPALINCAWDWGGGDWETPLGAAAHMGRRDIALYLLEHGARLDLFAATMLGHLEIVRATLAAFPATLGVAGPHGIPLIVHARKGGAEAAAVLAYLESLG
ncbi:MAG: ankyrin repeat domain-containing protein [Ktedonobacterales bacterium]|nr:ankyrin repeat domain-containing protein [Ktedonobacterales bacterium]